MSKTRAIRFSEQEEELIQKFLKTNQFFDFSSLARVSILNFIQDPQLEMHPVNISKKPKAKIEQRSI